MIWTTVLENLLFICLGWDQCTWSSFPVGGTSSILRTFLGGTSKKNHPVEDVHLLLVGDVCGFKVLAPPEKSSEEANIGGGGN